MAKLEVNLDIPDGIHERTRREVVYKGKVYIAEVRPKLKDTTPSWSLLAILVDGFAGLGAVLLYVDPATVWKLNPNYLFGAILLIAAVLIYIMATKGKAVQVTDP